MTEVVISVHVEETRAAAVRHLLARYTALPPAVQHVIDELVACLYARHGPPPRPRIH